VTPAGERSRDAGAGGEEQGCGTPDGDQHQERRGVGDQTRVPRGGEHGYVDRDCRQRWRRSLRRPRACRPRRSPAPPPARPRRGVPSTPAIPHAARGAGGADRSRGRRVRAAAARRERRPWRWRRAPRTPRYWPSTTRAAPWRRPRTDETPISGPPAVVRETPRHDPSPADPRSLPAVDDRVLVGHRADRPIRVSVRTTLVTWWPNGFPSPCATPPTELHRSPATRLRRATRRRRRPTR
jgi:hypothetical protein